MRRVLLLALMIALLPACARKGPRAAYRASVVALVGDRPVELRDFAAYVKSSAGEELQNVSPKVASSLLDQYLEELLLARAADDAAPPLLAKSPEERRRELVDRRARLDAIGDADLRAEYDAHPDRWMRPELVRLSQLLLPTEEKAKEAVRKLAAGAPWEAVSRSMSSAPNAKAGGTLGLLGRSDLPREFEKAIWALTPGGVTEPLAAPHGYHVFRLEERLTARSEPFEEARAAVRLEVAERRSGAAVAALLQEAEQAHPARVVEEHLPFPYVGARPAFR